MEEEIRSFKEYLDGSRHIVAITGAGVSRPAGILCFDHTNPEAVNLAKFLGSQERLRNRPEEYYAALDKAFLQPIRQNGPGPAHRVLARLEREGKVDGVVTTNIDCLHTIAGSNNVLELQGSLRLNRCVKCWEEYNDYQIWMDGEIPQCTKCKNPVWSFPFYSHMGLDDPVVRETRRVINEADLLLIVGSNGSYANYYWKYRSRRAKVVLVDPECSTFDRAADLTVREDADSVFSELEKTDL